MELTDVNVSENEVNKYFEDIYNEKKSGCQIADLKKNSSFITNHYEGIPEALLLNFIAFIIFLIAFTILRHRRWDYGKLKQVSSETMSQLFYYGAIQEEYVESASSCAISDSGYRWILQTWKVDHKQLIKKCGPDAANFMTFLRHLMLLKFLITIYSLCVILPQNMHGEEELFFEKFAITTLVNLSYDSKGLWLHIAGALSLGPLTALLMWTCPRYIPSHNLISSRTLMITGISKENRNSTNINKMITTVCPSAQIEDIQVACKVGKLTALEMERTKMNEAKMYCIENNNYDIKFQPHGCILCCRCRTQNAYEYFKAEEERLLNLVIEERKVALESPLSIAFITFDSGKTANEVLKNFKPGTVGKWHIKKAPFPVDLNWEYLEVSAAAWYRRAICININLCFVLFFLTTPALIVNLFFFFTNAKDHLSKFNPIISKYLPTLLMIMVTCAMPMIVQLSDVYSHYTTKTKESVATLYKTYFFLLLTILILPSLELTSLAGLIMSWAKDRIEWECMFLSDRGVFFLNYVIMHALLITGMELVRLPELGFYYVKRLMVKSKAQIGTVGNEILCIFPFHINYCWILTIYTISTSMSMACPLITIFGFLHLCLMYMVHKHNIYFIYRPVVLGRNAKRIHKAAVKLVYSAVILLQLNIGAFITMRGGLSKMSSSISTGLIITVISLIVLKPYSHGTKIVVELSDVGKNEKYVAPVLVRVSKLKLRNDEPNIK